MIKIAGAICINMIVLNLLYSTHHRRCVGQTDAQLSDDVAPKTLPTKPEDQLLPIQSYHMRVTAILLHVGLFCAFSPVLKGRIQKVY